MSVTNSVFLLAMVATSINLAHFPSAHVHNWRGRDRQHCTCTAGLSSADAIAQGTWGMCSREL